jgi:hypothetical protein
MSEREKALEAALLRWQSYGCPDCSGDCGSANPPVFCCIMQETRAALAMPSTVDGADFLRGWEAGRDAAAWAGAIAGWSRLTHWDLRHHRRTSHD